MKSEESMDDTCNTSPPTTLSSSSTQTKKFFETTMKNYVCNILRILVTLCPNLFVDNNPLFDLASKFLAVGNHLDVKIFQFGETNVELRDNKEWRNNSTDSFKYEASFLFLLFFLFLFLFFYCQIS